MESSESKVEIMKPVLVKTGISMAITIASFVLTRVVARKSPVSEPSSSSKSEDFEEGQENSCDLHRDDNEGFKRIEVDHTCGKEIIESAVIEEGFGFQEEILRMRSRMEDIQKRKKQIENRFLTYQDLKDREMMLMEIQNKLLLDTNQVEFWEKEISMLEAENQKFESMVLEYLKFLGLLEVSKSENVKMRKRVKKLLRKNKERRSWILRKKILRIKNKEADVLKNQQEMEVKSDCIKKMEDEIRELRQIVEQMQQEKNELLEKLRMPEISDKSKEKDEEEKETVENYNQLACALEQLQQEEAAEVKELVYLRWLNACLKHEVMRMNQEEENKELVLSSGGVEETGTSDNELYLGRGHSSLGITVANGGGGHNSHAHHHSKRRKIIEKFKKWVDGVEKHMSSDGKDQKHHCFPARHSSGPHVGKGGLFLPGRKSCSSA